MVIYGAIRGEEASTSNRSIFFIPTDRSTVEKKKIDGRLNGIISRAWEWGGGYWVRGPSAASNMRVPFESIREEAMREGDS